MVTVLEAARRVGRDPETVRRWIRSGKLPAKKVGLQHMIDEADLWGDACPELPVAWCRTATGEAMPDAVEAIRRMRTGR